MQLVRTSLELFARRHGAFVIILIGIRGRDRGSGQAQQADAQKKSPHSASPYTRHSNRTHIGLLECREKDEPRLNAGIGASGYRAPSQTKAAAPATMRYQANGPKPWRETKWTKALMTMIATMKEM